MRDKVTNWALLDSNKKEDGSNYTPKDPTQTKRVVLTSLELLQGHHLQRDVQVPVCQYGAGAQLIRQESSDDSYSLESECANFAKFRPRAPFLLPKIEKSLNHFILLGPQLSKSSLSLRSFCLLWGGWVVVEETSSTWWIWTHFSFRLFLNSW